MFHFGPPSLSMGTVRSWAADVSSRHLSDGADPTAELTKIAREQSLTPHQIEVLAGEINKTIHTAKCASATGDKYHAADFPLADAKSALNSLQIGEEKTASSTDGFFVEPVAGEGFDVFAAYGVKPEDMTKTASESSRDSRKEMEKMALLLQKQEDAYSNAQTEKRAAEMNLIKVATEYVLQGFDAADRLTKMADVIHAARASDCDAGETLAKVAHILGQNGYIHPSKAEEVLNYCLEKKADVTAPEGLISEFLPAKIVNGTHPLIISLKTLQKCVDREREERNRWSVIDDKLKNLRAQKFRAL